MESRFQAIAEEWFLTEPLLFSVYCSHQLKAMPVGRKLIPSVLRSGKGRIEYNPELIATLENAQLKEYLRLEMIRILLKHPYQRQPQPSRKEACYWASDLVLQDGAQPKVKLFGRDDFPGISFPGYAAAFEEYYRCLLPLCKSHSDSDEETYQSGETAAEKPDKTQEQAQQAAELWEEDQLMQEEVNRLIEIAEESHCWGSLSGQMKEKIMASTIVQVNCSQLLNDFRSSLLSTKRRLTRMRPNRRYGFEYMGSRHYFSTRLLVAVDVSGSVPTNSLRRFFGLVNRFFKYGIEKIDVIQFDSVIKGEPIPLKKARREINVLGRSGTDYQAVMDYVCQDGNYDGLIVCTDGFAAIPRLKKHIKTQILWVFNNRAFYEKHTWTDRLPHSRRAFIE